jgi:predicted enzyme related to lactoylglutathione lyase
MHYSPLLLLYVHSPQSSAGFYEKLLASPPIESSETFAMFMMESGLKLGLWARDGVAPSVGPETGGSELAFALESNAAVDEQYRALTARGIAIAQEPTHMDFGYTFVALDPDGHRLRMYARADV